MNIQISQKLWGTFFSFCTKVKIKKQINHWELSSACGSLYRTGETGMKGERKEGEKRRREDRLREKEKESEEGCGELEGGRERGAHWEGLT